MKSAGNLLLGFAISFVGSIPLGYLNVVGFNIFENRGMAALVTYLLGVVCVEVVVIYLTFAFARKLSQKQKLMRSIEIFSIIFMLLLAYIFWMQFKSVPSGEIAFDKYLGHDPFVAGVVCSGLNFIQIPFWVGWNLYLINNRIVDTQRSTGLLFVSGAAFGTFSGMFCFVLLLEQASNLFAGARVLVTHGIPLFFLAMALYQGFRYYLKYRTQNKPEI